MNFINFILSALGLLLASIALVISLYQVRNAAKTSKLHGEITALNAYLSDELAGRRDLNRIKKILELIFLRVEQLGAKDILELKDF